MRVGTCLLVRTAKEDLAENTIRVVEEEMDHGCLRKGIQKEKKKKSRCKGPEAGMCLEEQQGSQSS